MKNTRTTIEMLYERVEKVAKHAKTEEAAMLKITDSDQHLFKFFAFAQYLETKALEMKLIMADHIRTTTGMTREEFDTVMLEIRKAKDELNNTAN